MSESCGGVGKMQDVNGKYPKLPEIKIKTVKNENDIELAKNQNKAAEDVFVPKEIAASEGEKIHKKSILETIKNFFAKFKKPETSVVLKAESGGGSN